MNILWGENNCSFLSNPIKKWCCNIMTGWKLRKKEKESERWFNEYLIGRKWWRELYNSIRLEIMRAHFEGFLINVSLILGKMLNIMLFWIGYSWLFPFPDCLPKNVSDYFPRLMSCLTILTQFSFAKPTLDFS